MRLNSLSSLTQGQVEHWSRQAKAMALGGHLPDYIPQLAEVDGEAFAVQVRTVAGEVLTAGDWGDRFVLMSVVKPFLLLYLLERWGGGEGVSAGGAGSVGSAVSFAVAVGERSGVSA
ncbi:MAG: hypothetical protein HC860_23080 [Alkalinema sp. RU_4_3]|nr:hypothetical protein [Alkalinema sp. RU_4_3]